MSGRKTLHHTVVEILGVIFVAGGRRLQIIGTGMEVYNDFKDDKILSGVTKIVLLGVPMGTQKKVVDALKQAGLPTATSELIDATITNTAGETIEKGVEMIDERKKISNLCGQLFYL